MQRWPPFDQIKLTGRSLRLPVFAEASDREVRRGDGAPWPSFLRRAAETRGVLERRVQLNQQDAARLARYPGWSLPDQEYKESI